MGKYERPTFIELRVAVKTTGPGEGERAGAIGRELHRACTSVGDAAADERVACAIYVQRLGAGCATAGRTGHIAGESQRMGRAVVLECVLARGSVRAETDRRVEGLAVGRVARELDSTGVFFQRQRLTVGAASPDRIGSDTRGSECDVLDAGQTQQIDNRIPVTCAVEGRGLACT